MLIEEIDGLPAPAHPIAKYLVEAGFVSGALGLQAIATRPAPFPRPDASAGDTSHRPKRPATSKSSVSSPFASRYYTDTEEDY
jgi:hypothetical protein